LGTLADWGVIAIETSDAGVTVRTVDPVTDPEVALIVVTPLPVLVARPVLLTVAVEGVFELHIAVEVRFRELLSLNIPVAVNCCVVPKEMDELAGVSSIETSAAAVTVNVVVPVIEPEVAIIVVEPVLTALASPAETAVLLIVATVVRAELHCTVFVMFCVLPLLNVPVAMNCCVVPRGMLGIAGVTAIETKAADVTFRVVKPATDPEVAVAVVVPTARPVATPLASTLAML
jgi:hypothetical protein